MRPWVAVLVVCALAATLGPASSRAQTEPPGAPPAPQPSAGGLVAEPDLAVPLRDVVPFGSTAAGEVWAFGHTADGSVRIAALRGRAWQLQPPAAGGGSPLAGFAPAGGAAAPQHAGELSGDGTGVLLGTSGAAGGAGTQVVLGRTDGGDFKLLPAPPADVLHADEQLFDATRVAVAAVDGAILLAPAGGAVEDGVLRWSGATWTREPVVAPPAGFGGRFRILALGASSATDAWLLAEPAPDSGAAVALYRRVADPDPRWVEVALDPAPLLQPAAPADGIRALRAVSPPGDPLTVAAGHVWIDVHVTDTTGAESDATLHVATSGGAARLDHSWCDVRRPGGAPLCDEPLGAALETARGTRSVAVAAAGTPYGARVVAGAARPDGVTTGGGPLVLDGSGFGWAPGTGDDGDGGTQALALVGPAEAWLGARIGATHLTRIPAGTQLQPWAPPWFDELVDVASEPGKPTTAATTQALVAGRRFMVLHFDPGAGGWQFEPITLEGSDNFLPVLRAIAWPRADLAVAVGDGGYIYERRTGGGAMELGPRDQSAFWSPASHAAGTADLLDVAFDPADAERGYAVGRSGTVMRRGADGEWAAERLPGNAADADVYAVAFAGHDALIATSVGLLVNSGAGWRPDPQLGAQRVGTVAGLPDGGATADGRFVRERAGGRWRPVDAPPLEVAAVAAYRDDGGALRSIVSTTGQPLRSSGPPPAATADAPDAGFVLREDASGWHDEQHAAFRPSGTADLPLAVEPVRAFALDEHGGGWAVGGTGGPSPFVFAEPDNPAPPPPPTRAASAEVYRYRPAIAQPGTATAPIPLAPGVVRFALGGNAACLEHCAGLAGQGTAPDVLLDRAVQLAGSLAAQEHGPRALLYTGGRAAGGLDALDGERFRSLLSDARLPVFPALGRGDGKSIFTSVFATFASPLGAGPLAPGISLDGLPLLSPAAGAARTFYAFDSAGPDGTVRVVVIDQAQGSLGDADPGQEAWLRAVLSDARAKRTPAIVVGSRPLDDGLGPGAAGDGDRIARLLVDEGASAYVSGAAGTDPASAEFGGRLATGSVPAGAAADHSIPAFTTSTLGHKPAQWSALFDANPSPTPPPMRVPALALLEVQPGTRDPQTNRAQVQLRAIPLLRSLSLNTEPRAIRHQILFVNPMAREPDRGGYLVRRAGGDPIATRTDPLVIFCSTTLCEGGPQFEAQFESSDPQIGYFVRPAAGANDVERNLGGLPVASDAFPYFCPLKTGTVTLTVRSGGLSASQTIQVVDAPPPPIPPPPAAPRQVPGQATRPQRVCSFGEAEVGPSDTAAPAPDAAAPEPAPAPAPATATPPAKPPAKPPAADRPPPSSSAPPLPTTASGAQAQAPAHQTPVAPSPKPPSAGPPPSVTGGGALQPAPQPLPGVQPVAGVAPVAQVAPERREQAAPESEQAAVRYVPGRGDALPPAGVIILAIALAAGSGAAIVRSRGATAPVQVSAVDPRERSG
ncbi:MAG TPA: hypothetical protein VGC59_06860 [Solirubrobacteraceae bacterium]